MIITLYWLTLPKRMAETFGFFYTLKNKTWFLRIFFFFALLHPSVCHWLKNWARLVASSIFVLLYCYCCIYLIFFDGFFPVFSFPFDSLFIIFYPAIYSIASVFALPYTVGLKSIALSFSPIYPPYNNRPTYLYTKSECVCGYWIKTKRKKAESPSRSIWNGLRDVVLEKWNIDSE